MSGFWRDARITAWHELGDALRSRRALVMLLLYVGGTLLSTTFFVQILKQLEDSIMTSLGAGSLESVGRVAKRLTDTELWRRMLARITDSRELGLHLSTKTPLALYYFWISSSWAPILMAIISSTRVSDEVSTGASRFVLYRISLPAWVFGKYLGQAMLLVPALLASAAGAWTIGWFQLDTFEPLRMARELLEYGALVWFYVVAFLGIAVGASCLTRSSVLATVYALLGVMLTSALNMGCVFAIRFAGLGENGRGLFSLLRQTVPQGHRTGLLWSDPAHVVPSMFVLLTLSLMYLLPGMWRLARRDS